MGPHSLSTLNRPEKCEPVPPSSSRLGRGKEAPWKSSTQGMEHSDSGRMTEGCGMLMKSVPPVLSTLLCPSGTVAVTTGTSALESSPTLLDPARVLLQYLLSCDFLQMTVDLQRASPRLSSQSHCLGCYFLSFCPDFSQ